MSTEASETAAARAPALGIELLFERTDLPTFELPEALTQTYAGGLGFRTPRLFANFVASVDGVVALPVAGESGHIISRASEADRFVMGLLRTCADAVIVGAGTFRKSPGHVWRPEPMHPESAAAFVEARQRLGLSARPKFVLVTGSGVIDASQPALEDALIVTTRKGEVALRANPPPRARIAVLGSERVRFADIVDLLHAEGLRILLTEGGPSLLAELVAARLLDELFLTSSPLMLGRTPNDRRKSLADGLDLGGAPLELLSVRRSDSHLFLRYALSPTD